MDRSDNPPGEYLRDRRARLDPAALGLPAKRRRIAGLRREEVVQRANIRPTWYTWLEQGRGGAASPDVPNRRAALIQPWPTRRLARRLQLARLLHAGE